MFWIKLPSSRRNAQSFFPSQRRCFYSMLAALQMMCCFNICFNCLQWKPFNILRMGSLLCVVLASQSEPFLFNSNCVSRSCCTVIVLTLTLSALQSLLSIHIYVRRTSIKYCAYAIERTFPTKERFSRWIMIYVVGGVRYFCSALPVFVALSNWTVYASIQLTFVLRISKSIFQFLFVLRWETTCESYSAY